MPFFSYKTFFTKLFTFYSWSSSVMSILESAYILSPKATMAKKKRFKKQLETQMNSSISKDESILIQSNLVSVHDAHSRRPRVAYFG